MKPSITCSQLNQLIFRVDDSCVGRTPFVCADGTSSDRLLTELFNAIEEFFDIVEENK